MLVLEQQHTNKSGGERLSLFINLGGYMNYRDYDCIVDSNDIRQCIEEIEVGDLGEHIYYGPQAEVMEKEASFIESGGEWITYIPQVDIIRK